MSDTVTSDRLKTAMSFQDSNQYLVSSDNNHYQRQRPPGILTEINNERLASDM